jgi:hypothetical protein
VIVGYLEATEVVQIIGPWKSPPALLCPY